MAGFWPNPGNPNSSNLGMLMNQALQSGGNPLIPSFFSSEPVLGSLGNDINAARAYLAATIPSSQPTFPVASGSSSVKTSSVITLPPSLTKLRPSLKKGERSASTASQNVNSMSASTSFNQVASTSSTALTSASTRNPFAVNSLVSGVQPSKVTAANTGTGAMLAGPKVSGSGEISSTPGSSKSDTNLPVFSKEIGMGKDFPQPAVSDPPPIVLDPLAAQQKLMPYGAHRLLHDNDFWHKFIVVGGAKMDRDKVLKRILEASEPTLMIPVLYQDEGEDAVFFSRVCGSSIERIFRNNRLIFDLYGGQFFIHIHLQYASIHKLRLNVASLLRQVVTKRLKADQGVLDLSRFHHDPDLSTFLYCPLSQPSILHHILQVAIGRSVNFSILNLSHNGLRQLKIEILLKAPFLLTLDLSHNELLYQKDLQDLKELDHVTKLVLDGNPVCAEFKTSEEYIRTLKSLMPQLRSLDHVSLLGGAIYVTKEQNFLCCKSGHQLVDQFLKHYFDRYDWTDRRCLDGLYHENALFSLTCLHLPGHSTSEGSKLAWYTGYNRNIAKLSDYSKADKLIFHGPSEILDLFCSLPASEHDPYSFCVDLIHYNNKVAVVSVTGVFREHPTLPPDSDHMRAFRRVFVLTCVGQSEWQITNEQLHISNATTQQAETAFKIKKPALETPVAAWLVQDAQLLSEEEKDQMSSIMMQLTTLNKEWATRFLVESHWYVREALIAFVNQYELKALPQDAFINQNA